MARFESGLMDVDSDGFVDWLDNCVFVSNATQANTDGDVAGDACDAFPLNPSALDDADADADGIGNSSDHDDDGDGTPDVIDLDPLHPAVSENDLPMNGAYKGSVIRDAVQVE